MGISKVIRILIASNFFLQSGWGLIAPIFAIFIVQDIKRGSLEMVGLIAAVYWITKSIIQPFIARYFDIKKGEKDDFFFLIIGMYTASLIPLGYLFSSHVSHIFILEFIRGIAMAFVVPTWAAIFTRHVNKGWEAFSWSVDSTMIGFAFGFAAAFGGILATAFGFEILFIFVSVMGLISSSTLFLIKPYLLEGDGFNPRFFPSKKPEKTL